MRKLKSFNLFILMMLFVAAMSFGTLCDSDAAAQDTSSTVIVEHDIGYSRSFDFTKDSTQATVTDWFDLTEFNTSSSVSGYVTVVYVDTSYGRSAGNDTVRCIVQGKDAANNIINCDTVGSGNEGSEKLISTGSVAQYTFTPKKHTPLVRFYFEAVNSGGNVNGRGRIKGSLFFK